MESLSDQRGAIVTGTASPESTVSAVSWPAIALGAIVACSVSLILLALGSGIGLASVSPWPGSGASATTFTVMTAIWLIVVQWVASGLGGYLTGRLRTKWVHTHTHEVFFRDTAHGFAAWAVATIVTALVLAYAATAAIGAGAQAAGAAVSGAAQGAAKVVENTVTDYDIDTLFRSSRADPNVSGTDARTEATHIFLKSLATGDLSAADRTYLAQLISSQAGISQEDAAQRVDQANTAIQAAQIKARQAADVARKAAASTSIYSALSMLVGAFIASVAAALGGRQRDKDPTE